MTDIQKKILSVDLSEEIQLVENTELIKVQVIKKKYFEQMTQAKIPDMSLSPFKVLGRTSYQLLIQWPDKSLAVVHMTDYREYLMDLIRYKLRASNEQFNTQEVWEYVDEEYSKIPQLFTT